MIHPAEELITIDVAIIRAGEIKRAVVGLRLSVEIRKSKEPAFRERTLVLPGQQILRHPVDEGGRNDIVRERRTAARQANGAAYGRIGISRIPAVTRLQNLGEVTGAHGQ